MGARWSRLFASSRLLRASALLAVLAMIGFAINAVHPVLPWWILWLPSVAGSCLMVVHWRRAARADHLPAPTRLFWRRLFPVSVLVCLGSVAQAYDMITVADPSGEHISPGQMLCDGLAIGLIIYALLRLPFGRQSGSELFRIVLDAGTVMLACAIFAWHFSTRHALHGGDQGMIYVSLALTTLALLAVFAVAKVMLTRPAGFIDRTALRMIGVGVLVGALSSTLRPLVEPMNAHLFPGIVGMPLIFFLAGWAAERQRAADYTPRRGVRERPRRSFSFLPYVAIAAVDALLLSVALPESAPDRRVVVISAVALTALVVVRQVTAFVDNGRLLSRLDHGATHDALTQLPNRRLFHERLTKALTAPGERSVAVALIDLDDFKEVNDTLGHEVGDLLLIAVAERLNGCIRAEDTVARLGGDEFVVVLDGADPAAADLAAQRMMAALRAPVLADGHELPIRASIGIADGRAGDEAGRLLRHADIAMYAAKAIAGTASLHFTPDMAQAGADNAHLGAELRDAIDGDQLYLLYQPIVALSDRRVIGAEALVRWRHPTHGTMPPQSFLPLAESTGLIVPLSRWVLRAAFRQLSAWTAAHGEDAPAVLNVNVSPRDLREPGFAALVAALLDEYGVPPHRITLEVTESMPVDPHESSTTLTALRSLGVRVALDDFGTGHSTLTMLHDWPIDQLKLDITFTQAEVNRVPVAATVLQVADTLGLQTIAEGVETPDQAARLHELGYRSAQGFLFAHPLSPEEFGDLLATARAA
ncbi:EAL domain-containing protein [Actinoplanes sp. KI2]|uniref:putative bifunctional diguanylate cyclase/phosphodiesterase n=1 Tax=Actinoplanes sp. KI2 TaxID=2983315 RepID=UPI0021D59471|nr:EAL domain-containing protein [Actinoplanes sp. KI2]MCU7729755.1 EAL domain-containing protein [Actinoplanes sp. KI2]